MIEPEVLARMQSPEFAKILENDPVLKELEDARSNPRDEVAAIAQLLGGGYSVNDLPLRPLTAADWSLWWALDVAFARGRGPEERDVDIALWFLVRPFDRIQGSFKAIDAAAKGFCAMVGIDWTEGAGVITTIIDDAFRPLGLLPPCGPGDGEPPKFDADWLSAIMAIVARLMQYPAHKIAVERPLSEVCYFFVWARAQADPKMQVRRRTPADLCGAIWERTLELARGMKDGRD